MSTLATIRKATLADAQAISALSRTQIEHGLPQKWTPQNVARVLKRSDTNAYSLLCNDKLSGFTLSSFGVQHMHLILHAVTPALRRQGFGRELLQWQIDAAMVAGITTATLEVRAGNKDAQNFYQKLLFRPSTVIAGYYSSREDAIRMRRDPLFCTG